jgi:hypothetical protein
MKRTAAIISALVAAALVAAANGGATSTTAQAVVTPKTKLALKVGPGFTITLKTSTGKAVSSLKAGTYTILVNDTSSIHNAHLIAPGGVNKKTGVSFVGKVTWKVKLAKGTLKYQCDPHVSTMHGSKKIV